MGRIAFLATIALGTAVLLGGCTSNDDADQPKLQGKPDIKETPPGTVAPGDVRTSDDARG